jgi:hypothetical protein
MAEERLPAEGREEPYEPHEPHEKDGRVAKDRAGRTSAAGLFKGLRRLRPGRELLVDVARRAARPHGRTAARPHAKVQSKCDC